jgi:hypothetical protein
MKLSLCFTLFAVSTSGCALDMAGTEFYVAPAVDAEVPTVDAGTATSPAASSTTTIRSTTDAACNRLVAHGYLPVPMLCTDIQVVGDPVATNPANYYTTTVDSSKDGFLCNLVAAPLECSGCDYTCECFMKAAGPMSHCSCSQDAPNAYVAMVCP